MPQAIIMAGGPGERFWPLTTKTFPKYRIRLDGKRSLLYNTYERLLRLYDKKNVGVVTTREHVGLIREELPSLGRHSIIVEPFRNNTASAVLYATALATSRRGPEETVSFFPADHLIVNEKLFGQTMRTAMRLASAEPRLVTIGIKPTFPAVGYGYIQTGRAVGGFSGVYAVAAYKEKPKLPVARRYLAGKNYLWNGGIFTWRAGVFLDTMRRFAPSMLAAFKLGDVAGSYKKLPKLSIDYALLEKADNIAVVKTRMDWCDMGSWDMFYEKGDKDKDGNLILGQVRSGGSRRSLLLNYTDEPLTALNAFGMILVKTAQGMLVCPRSHSEEAALLARRL